MSTTKVIIIVGILFESIKKRFQFKFNDRANAANILAAALGDFLEKGEGRERGAKWHMQKHLRRGNKRENDRLYFYPALNAFIYNMINEYSNQTTVRLLSLY